jgi:adenylate kinase
MPAKEGICDRCGGALVHRTDDEEHLISERLETYRAATYPLVNFYKNVGVYHHINGARPISQVTEEILSLIDGHAPLTPTSKGRDQKFA